MNRHVMNRAIGVSLSAWELAALSTGRIPALTDIIRRNPVLGALATGWVAAHVLHYQPPSTPLHSTRDQRVLSSDEL